MIRTLVLRVCPFAVTAFLVVSGSVPVWAAVEKQPVYEFAPGVPIYPRDAMGKPKTAELLLNLNVADPANPGQMKSLPVLVTLDPTKVKTPEDKAKAIADAINNDAQIKDNNKKLRAAKRNKEQTTAEAQNGPIHTYDKAGKVVKKFPAGWHVHLTDLHYDLTQPQPAARCPLYKVKDETKEPGSAAPGQIGGGTTPTPTPTPSPGSMGGTGKSATGYTPDSSIDDLIPSDVSFGYFNDVDGSPGFVATVYPVPGQSESSIMSMLASALNTLGAPAHYDSLTNELTLDVLLGANQTFWFDDTDAGLDFTISMPAFYSFPVPEPATIALVTIGGMLLPRRGRRQRS